MVISDKSHQFAVVVAVVVVVFVVVVVIIVVIHSFVRSFILFCLQFNVTFILLFHLLCCCCFSVVDFISSVGRTVGFFISSNVLCIRSSTGMNVHTCTIDNTILRIVEYLGSFVNKIFNHTVLVFSHDIDALAWHGLDTN